MTLIRWDGIRATLSHPLLPSGPLEFNSMQDAEHLCLALDALELARKRVEEAKQKGRPVEREDSAADGPRELR